MIQFLYKKSYCFWLATGCQDDSGFGVAVPVNKYWSDDDVGLPRTNDLHFDCGTGILLATTGAIRWNIGAGASEEASVAAAAAAAAPVSSSVEADRLA